MKVKMLLASLAVALLAACATNDNYDADITARLIEKYNAEMMSEQDYNDMMGQFKGLTTGLFSALVNISVIQDEDEMEATYQELRDSEMYDQYRQLAGIVADASSRGKLDRGDRRLYKQLRPIMDKIDKESHKIERTM